MAKKVKRRKPMTTAERVAAHRARKIEKGESQINVTLSNSIIEKLDRIAEKKELTRADVITQLINKGL